MDSDLLLFQQKSDLFNPFHSQIIKSFHTLFIDCRNHLMKIQLNAIYITFKYIAYVTL